MPPKTPLAKVDNRKKCYTLLAMGQQQLGWDEEFYRGIWLPQQGAGKDKNGRYSATTMDIGQLFKAVQVMRDLGFNPNKKYTHAKPDWRAPRIAKLDALWCAMADAGVVEDRSHAALEKWAKNYTKRDRLQWASSADLNQLVEMLKRWAASKGVALKD